MPRPRVYKTQAIVLRQRKLGEADRRPTSPLAAAFPSPCTERGLRGEV